MFLSKEQSEVLTCRLKVQNNIEVGTKIPLVCVKKYLSLLQTFYQYNIESRMKGTEQLHV